MYGQNGYVTYYNTSGQHYNNYYANNPNRHHRPKFESNRHFETPSNGAPQPDQQGPQRYGTFPQKRWYEKWSTRQPRNNADSSPRPKHDPEEVKGLVVQGVSKRAKPKARANPKPLQQQQDQQHESQSQQQVDPNVEEQLAKESKIDGKEVSTGTGGGVSPDEQKPYLEGPSSSQSSPVDCSISGNNSPRSNGNAALPSNNRNQFGRRNYSNQKNTLGNLSNQQNQKQRNGFKQWDNSSMPKNHGYRNNYNNNYSNHHPNTNHHHANMGGYGMGYIKSLKPFQNYAPASIQAPERCSQEDPLEPRHSFNDEDVNSVVKILREFASDMEVTAEDEPPEALLNGSCWDQLSSDIWSRYVESMQKKDLLLKKINAWILLMKSMKQIFPDFNLIAPDRFSCESATNTYKLYLVGSTCSGFGLRSSDVDTCIMVTNYEVDQHAHAFPFLQQLKLDIENLRIPGGLPVDLRTMNLISAKVPILKFEDVQWGIQFDVNCNNPVGVRNTHLLFHYSQIEWRVRPLVVLVKVWAKCHGINDAKDMTLSSYSLTLMVIHYLQCGVQPPVLPCLQKMSNKFSPDQPLHMLSVLNFPHERENIKPFLSKNHQPLGELLLGFFEYYSVFDFNQNAISVRLGTTIPVESCRSKRTPKNDPGQWKFISIEEPFEQTNTARAVFELSRFHYILDVFRHCAKVLEERRTLDCIFDRILPMRTISTIVGNHPGPAAGNIPVGNHLAIPATINNPNPTVTRVSTAPFQL